MAVFTGQVPAASIGDRGVEYYVELSDGDNIAVYPPSAPQRNLSLIALDSGAAGPRSAPANLRADGKILKWIGTDPRAHQYRIYRSRQPDFVPGPDTFLTFVAKDTLAFQDSGFDLEGRPFQGAWYYRVTSVDQNDNESSPTPWATITY
jgi:hypothetical protein